MRLKGQDPLQKRLKKPDGAFDKKWQIRDGAHWKENSSQRTLEIQSNRVTV